METPGTADRYASYPSLAGKRVLITGGGSGIGRTMAQSFVAQGARVGSLDRDADASERLGVELGPGHASLVCDVTDTEAMRAAVDQIADTLGGLNVVIANAADDTRHDVHEIGREDWDELISVNLSHQFFLAQSAEPFLRVAGGGSILCLGSIAWLNNSTGMVAYTTAKAGVHGLVRTLARLWGKGNVRINALVPGWTMTERQLDRWIDEDAEREIDAGQCLPGRVMPADVARMALFLASDDAAMITRQSFVVDGGWV